MSEHDDHRRVLGPWSAGWVVVATMVGAGIFSTVGELCVTLSDVTAIFVAWGLGGVLALAGALCFAELGTMHPRGGGEYAYTTWILGPTAGFMTGYISFCAGFAAALGIVSLALGEYVEALVPGMDRRAVAATIVACVCSVHAYGVRHGARFNDVAAALKMALLATFVIGGFFADAGTTATETVESTGDAPSPAGVFSAALATALVTVTFSYTGWNAAGYIGGEVRQPGRTLPRALLGGTLAVTVLYLLVNAVYFHVSSPAELAGEAETGHIIARLIFGEGAGDVLGWAIVLVLLSTVSAFVMTGPRIIVSMAEDGLIPAALEKRNGRGAPYRAVLLLGLMTMPFIWIGALGDTLYYVGITMNAGMSLAILSVIVARRRFPDAPRPFRMPLYPLTPVAYLALATWMTVVSVRQNPDSVIASIATLAFGLVLRFVLARRPQAK